jgi:hypothetical protein
MRKVIHVRCAAFGSRCAPACLFTRQVRRSCPRGGASFAFGLRRSVLRRPANRRLSLPLSNHEGKSSTAGIHRKLGTLLVSSSPSAGSGKHMNVQVRSMSLGSAFSLALRGTAAPESQVGSGASYRSRRATLGGVAARNSVRVERSACLQASPNPSIEGTSTMQLRCIAAAPHVKR